MWRSLIFELLGDGASDGCWPQERRSGKGKQRRGSYGRSVIQIEPSSRSSVRFQAPSLLAPYGWHSFIGGEVKKTMQRFTGFGHKHGDGTGADTTQSCPLSQLETRREKPDQVARSE